MSPLFYFLLLTTPSMALITGFISSLIFIQQISNQWPSNEQVIVVFLLGILGMASGGFIGYVLCSNKIQYGGWSWNCLPDFYTFCGGWIGATMISLLTSYFLATTQHWVNNQGPSNNQILLMCLLILLEVIVWWFYLLLWVKFNKVKNE